MAVDIGLVTESFDRLLRASEIFLVVIPKGSVLSLSLPDLFWKSDDIIDLPVKLFLRLQNSDICQPQSALVVQEVTQSDSSELIEVIIAQEHVAPGQSPIPAGSSDFLDVVLDTPRQVVVDN